MVNATRLITSCGRFDTRRLHMRNIAVPKRNDRMFQGYTEGPMLFIRCPPMIKAAPIHCRVSLSILAVLVIAHPFIVFCGLSVNFFFLKENLFDFKAAIRVV